MARCLARCFGRLDYRGFIFFTFCLLQVSVALKQEELRNIDDFVQQVMECRNVPAMSVSIVSGPGPTETIAKGYGQADVEKNVSADSNTRFAVGSVTKAFTVTLLANLLSESKGKYSWDTPVRDIMGQDFRFVDEQRTKYATLRDLAAHKMGLFSYILPTVAGLDPSHSPMDYCMRMRYLKPYKRVSEVQLRTTFIYSNLMFGLLACVTEKLGNDTFSNLLRIRILEPLNMTSTILLPDIEKWTTPEYALPYVFYNGSLASINTDVAGGIHPFDGAGSVVSTAEDMVKWMRYHLGLSRVNLANPAIINQIYQPQFSIPLSPNGVRRPTLPFSDEQFSYDMAWMSGTYRGFRFTEHNGLISGYGAHLRLYGEVKAGVYVDTSGPMYTDAYLARSTVLWYISELLLGLEPVMNASVACTFPQPFLPTPPSRVNPFAGKVPTTVPDEQAKRATGKYGHPLFGNVTISKSDSKPGFLELKFGRLLSSTLGATAWADPRHPDLLGGSLTGDLWYFLDTGPVPFSQNGALLYALFQGEANTQNSFQNLTLRMPVTSLEAPITFHRGLKWDEELPVQPISPVPKCRDTSGQNKLSVSYPFTMTVLALIFLVLAGNV